MYDRHVAMAPIQHSEVRTGTVTQGTLGLIDKGVSRKLGQANGFPTSGPASVLG